MNEANQMHRDLMNALLPILPRKVHRDIRCVVNLMWAVVGLCVTHSVRLGAWGEKIPIGTRYAAENSFFFTSVRASLNKKNIPSADVRGRSPRSFARKSAIA